MQFRNTSAVLKKRESFGTPIRLQITGTSWRKKSSNLISRNERF